MDDAALQSSHCGLSAITDAQAAEDDVHMALHRALGDSQFRSYLLVTFPLNYQGQNILLARSKRRIWSTTGEAARHRRRNYAQTSVDFNYRVNHHLRWHAFDQISLRPGLKRLKNIFIAFIRCHYDEPALREF